MSGIDVKVKAGRTKDESLVEATGTLIHGITKKEVESFGLSEENLKKGVEKHHGKSPDKVAFDKSGSCGHLYEKYDWKEVQTVLTVASARILEVTSKPTIVDTKKLKNNSKKRAKFDAGIKQEVQNTTATNWSQTDTINISQSFKYSVQFLGAGLEGTTTMSYSHAWGQGGSESQTITVGSTANVSVELDPGESVKALLTASRGVMKVQIVYHANVIGNVVVDYSKGYKGHHYWCFDVSEIRASIDNNDPLEFKEDIEIGFFANADVELEDHDESTTNKDKKKDEQNGTSKKLNCDGRACNTCGKCVDWQIGGNQETWNWIRKFNSWKDGDWDRWRNDGVCKSFIKGDGATCKDVAECGSEEGSARYHSYIFLVHVCFCQPRLKAEGGQQAPNACTQQ